MKKVRYQTIIGRSETIELPDFLLSDIPAKTDTGAYRSAIHAENVQEKTVGGKKVLCFSLLLNHPAYVYSRDLEVSEYKQVEIENSFSVSETRYVVDFRVKLAGKVFRTSFTLANRSKKTYPILMGRDLLNQRFLVDSARSNIDRRDLKAKMNIDLAEDDEVKTK